MRHLLLVPLLALLGGCWPLLPDPHVPFADDTEVPDDTVDPDDTDVTADTDVVPTEDCPEGIRTTDADADADSFGDEAKAKETCGIPAGRVANGGDCDDTDDAVNPDAAEVCGGGDEDCDDKIDDADADVDVSGQKPVYTDADGDGFGDAATETLTCAPAGLIRNGDDCDDSNPDIGVAADRWRDADGDGVGNGVSLGVGCPGVGQVAAGGDVDCDDGAADIYPGAIDKCADGVDQDCAAGDKKCKVLGFFDVGDGPDWMTNPPVLSCLDTCALLLGGTAADYQCSTSNVAIDNLGFVTGWGDIKFCSVGKPEDFTKEDPAMPGYDCGTPKCSYSAWTLDQCVGSVNYCWTP